MIRSAIYSIKPVFHQHRKISTNSVPQYVKNINEKDIAEANARGRGNWALTDTPNKGWGIYAQRDFEPNTKIFEGRGLIRSQDRNTHSVQIDWDAHVLMDLPAVYINHSCDANAGIKDNKLGAFDFFAVKPIKKGDEITWDYGASEFDSISFSDCLCGNPKCRKGKIGFRFAQNDIKSLYGDYIAGYLKSYKP